MGDNIRRVIDQMGFQVMAPENPYRIISLVPSQTELLFHLGLDEQITGVTKFCCHPANRIKDVQKIGGPKKFNFGIIDQLKPDLILGNKEENYQEGINQLKGKYPVWMSDISTLEGALDMITKVGSLVNKVDSANVISESILNGFSQHKTKKRGRALYVIWQNPTMVAGGDTFINDMMLKSGFENAAAHLTRYPELSAQQIAEINPDAILLSSEPFPFKEKHAKEWRAQFDKKIHLVDGEFFSWYGSRLIQAPDYFQSIDLS